MSSPTLLTLPKELRLQIYGYVFAPSPPSVPVPLAPLHAICCTSKAIYLESIRCYLDCRESYYSSSHFKLFFQESLHARKMRKVEARILAIPKKDFDRIRHLTITVRPRLRYYPNDRFNEDHIYTLFHPLGGWRIDLPYIGASSPPGEFGDDKPIRCRTYRRFRPHRIHEARPPAFSKWHCLWRRYYEESKLIEACNGEEWEGQGTGGLEQHVLDVFSTGMLQ